MGFFDNPLEAVRDFVAAPAKTISKVADNLVAPVLNHPILNPVGALTSTAISATTGITPGQQLIIGGAVALGGLYAGIGAASPGATQASMLADQTSIFDAGSAGVGAGIAPGAGSLAFPVSPVSATNGVVSATAGGITASGLATVGAVAAGLKKPAPEPSGDLMYSSPVSATPSAAFTSALLLAGLVAAKLILF